MNFNSLIISREEKLIYVRARDSLDVYEWTSCIVFARVFQLNDSFVLGVANFAFSLLRNGHRKQKQKWFVSTSSQHTIAINNNPIKLSLVYVLTVAGARASFTAKNNNNENKLAQFGFRDGIFLSIQLVGTQGAQGTNNRINWHSRW